MDKPTIGSLWKHHNGIVYKVTALANTRSDNPKYPVQVLYENIHNKTLWARNLDDWHRSMTRLRDDWVDEQEAE